MFNPEAEYIAATEHASINSDNRGTSRRRFGIFNLFLLTTIGLMGYVSFDSLKEEASFLKKNSLTIDESSTDKDLLDALSKVDADSIESKSNLSNKSLNDAINSIVNSSSFEDNSGYTKALSQEISHKKGFTIIVQEGDTLASLSQKYYRDERAYHKIIANNESLTEKSNTIYVGQKIYLPY
jgi:nucleoid-associated protein YgaU